MNDVDSREERGWDSGWDAHTIAQRRRLARLTLSEKLEWLEEAQQVARKLSGDRPPREHGSSSDSERPGDRPQPARDPQPALTRPPDFWDDRFAEPGYAYGSEPNDFVRACAGAIPPGRVICLGEGQGRNAVFLATRGFDVTAMDQSRVGLERARALAHERGVTIATVAADLAEFELAPGAWQGIVSVFIHLPSALRRPVHERVVAGLAPGGVFVFEAYVPAQLELKSGGPEDLDRLPPLAALVAELDGLQFEIAREVERDVTEGRYHTGRAATAQILARKPLA